MKFSAIATRLREYESKPRRGRIAGCEVEAVYYPASDTVAFFVEGQKMRDMEEAAFVIYEMHRKSGIA